MASTKTIISPEAVLCFERRFLYGSIGLLAKPLQILVQAESSAFDQPKPRLLLRRGGGVAAVGAFWLAHRQVQPASANKEKDHSASLARPELRMWLVCGLGHEITKLDVKSLSEPCLIAQHFKREPRRNLLL